MDFLRIKISLAINYFLYGILLNSVGTVILQSQRYYQVMPSQAALLEACKDLSIAIVSFLIASYIPKIGIKRSMQIGLIGVAIACFTLPLIKTFLAVKLLFVVTGATFALIKISVYSTIGLISKDEKAHVSLMSFIESFFMVGIFAGYFLFSYFMDDDMPHSTRWFGVYYLIGAMYVFAWLLLSTSKIVELDKNPSKNEQKSELKESFYEMLQLIVVRLVLVFIICAFIYVLVEQSIMSWLPTYNSKVLNLPSSISVIMASVLSASIAAGRFLAGVLLKKIKWQVYMGICLSACVILILIAMPLASEVGKQTVKQMHEVPLAAYVFPCIGFFLAPIYPVINSLILAALPKHKHAAMTGLIVVFSALGGTFGSFITGNIFRYYGGTKAFYLSLVPLTLLAIALFFFDKLKKTHQQAY